MFNMISPLEAVLLNYSFVLFLSSVFSAGHLYFFSFAMIFILLSYFSCSFKNVFIISSEIIPPVPAVGCISFGNVISDLSPLGTSPFRDCFISPLFYLRYLVSHLSRPHYIH